VREPEADALTPEMRQTIRSTLRRLEDGIRAGVQMSVDRSELARDAPVDGITLQISSVMYQRPTDAPWSRVARIGI